MNFSELPVVVYLGCGTLYHYYTPLGSYRQILLEGLNLPLEQI
jgi:hypothetical protein